MSLSYELDGEFLRYTVEGDVDFQEGFAVFQQGLAEAEATVAAGGAPRPVLFDIRASKERRSAEELKGIATALGRHRGTVADHCAIVVSTPLYYGLGRMFGHFAEEYGITMEIFDDPLEAEAWLRAPAPRYD